MQEQARCSCTCCPLLQPDPELQALLRLTYNPRFLKGNKQCSNN